MKKLLKFVLLIPLSSIFLSGCMNKTIQKTIAVTTNISSDEELQDRDYFGVSRRFSRFRTRTWDLREWIVVHRL